MTKPADMADHALAAEIASLKLKRMFSTDDVMRLRALTQEASKRATRRRQQAEEEAREARAARQIGRAHV